MTRNKTINSPTTMLFHLALWIVFLTACSARAFTIHVAPHGSEEHHLCGSASIPCSLGTALDVAIPYSTLRLSGGVYRGGYHVTVPVRLVAASNSTVVLDGASRHRPLTFENVRAHVEGIAFRNGLGEGAGCALVNMVTGGLDGANNFTKCSFVNCTALAPDPGRVQGVGGAVAILYERSAGSTYELNRVTMESNYGRSSSAAAAGGLLIRYGRTTTYSQRQPCRTFVLQNAESQHSLTGTYTRVGNAVFGDKPVYESLTAANGMIKNAELMPHLVAYCPSKKSWNVVATPPNAPGSVTDRLAQHSPCSNALMSTFPRVNRDHIDSPSACNKWVQASNQVIGESIAFQCQDAGAHCRTLILSQAVSSQQHRNGVFVRSNLTRAGRPTYTRVPDGDIMNPQYIWYCGGHKEWIVSDEDPSKVDDYATSCSRGIASTETLAMHPMMVTSWRFWDVDMWRSSAGRGGIRLFCAPEWNDQCQTVEIPNIPQDFFPGPYLLSSISWNNRPTYYAVNRSAYLWYCGNFSEWAVSETDPRELNPKEERCSRALSSHPTQSIAPHLITTPWAQFLDDEWVPTPPNMKVRCIDNCPRILIESIGSAQAKGNRRFLGLYSVIGYVDDVTPNMEMPIYRKLLTGVDDEAFLYYVPRRGCWVMSGTLELETGGSPYAESCSYWEGVKLRVSNHHLLRTIGWTFVQTETIIDPQPTFSCDRHSRCSRINVTAVLYVRQEYLIGVYEQLPTLFHNRPMYLHTNAVGDNVGEEHYMYYCGPHSKWVIGPKPENQQSCAAWVASRSTGAMHPLVNVQWVMNNGDGSRWETSTVSLRMDCADVPSEETSSTTSTTGKASTGKKSSPDRTTKAASKAAKDSTSTSLVWDTFSDCTFHHNVALSHNELPASGAVLLHYGRTAVGDDPYGYIRRTTAKDNEGMGETSVGGIAVLNDFAFRPVYFGASDLQLHDNRGGTGGLLLDGVRGQLNRVQLGRNMGYGKGGGLRLLHQSNVSGTTVMCRHNYAQRLGGCGHVDYDASLYLTRSEVANNTALDNEGTTFYGGTISVTDSKLLQVNHYTIAACFLTLSSSELNCAHPATPSSLANGFGCVTPVAARARDGMPPDYGNDSWLQWTDICLLIGAVAIIAFFVQLSGYGTSGQARGRGRR